VLHHLDAHRGVEPLGPVEAGDVADAEFQAWTGVVGLGIGDLWSGEIDAQSVRERLLQVAQKRARATTQVDDASQAVR
jgi:hypothetical protein